MVFLAPIKRELSEMIIILKIKKNFKTAFFWHEDKRIKTTIFGKNNYQHCVGMLLPRLNTKDAIFHL